MFLKLPISFLIICFSCISIAMENVSSEKINKFDEEEMLNCAIRLSNSSLQNILINYHSFDPEKGIEDIDKFDIPKTLIDEIKMRKIMSCMKRSSKADDTYDDLNLPENLKTELILRKKQLFDALIDKIETDENLKELCKEIIEGLKETKDINFQPDKTYEAMIHLISKQGNVDLLKHIIALGADVKLEWLSNFCPLHGFASPDIAACLLLEGCNINAQDKFKRTPLMYLCSLTKTPVKNLLENAKFLLDHGCDVNFTNEDGNTAITFARRYEQKALEELFKRYELHDIL